SRHGPKDSEELVRQRAELEADGAEMERPAGSDGFALACPIQSLFRFCYRLDRERPDVRIGSILNAQRSKERQLGSEQRVALVVAPGPLVGKVHFPVCTNPYRLE